MRSPKTASIYQREYEKKYGRRFWITPAINKKFFKLDDDLKNLNINPEEYVMYCIRKWDKFAKNKNLSNVMIRIDNLCGMKSIEKYVAEDPITDKDYLYSVLLAIEESVAIGMIEAHIEMSENRDKNIQPYLDSIESWRSNEFGVCYNDSCTYEEAKRKYPGMYDKVTEKISIYVCTKYGVRFEFADYDYIAKQILNKRRKNGNS